MPKDVIAFNQARIADGLALTAATACQQGAAGHCLQIRNLGVGDVSALVAGDPNRHYTLQNTVLIAFRVEI
ncbi:hypothetical protein A7X91_05035 [Stenotrophomonas maltophilia]|nr:hypothetical protein A7X91_05035 [Stenotrophomonas maltophilia]